MCNFEALACFLALVSGVCPPHHRTRILSAETHEAIPQPATRWSCWGGRSGDAAVPGLGLFSTCSEIVVGGVESDWRTDTRLLPAGGADEAAGVVGLPERRHHLALDEVLAAEAAGPVQPLVVQSADVFTLPHKEAPLSQLAAAHWRTEGAEGTDGEHRATPKTPQTLGRRSVFLVPNRNQT